MPHRYAVTITLDRVRVTDDRDPFFLAPGAVRFRAVVFPEGRRDAAQETRLPARGVYRLRAGEEQVVQRVIYEGEVDEGETLSVLVTGTREGRFPFPRPFGRREDEVEPYRRRLSGHPESWAGRYGPGDEPTERDVERRAEWSVWYDVQVEPVPEEVGDGTVAWGPDRDWASMKDERRDRHGHFDPDLWQKARRHKERMHLPHARADAPSWTELEGNLRASVEVTEGERIDVGVGRAEDPLERPSMAAVGRYVRVHAPGESLHGATAALRVGIHPEDMAGHDPGTARVFRWDERVGRWNPVQRSALHPSGDFVWARINRPGVYGVFALPSDRARRTTMQMMYVARHWSAGMARLGGELGEIVNDEICKVILCRQGTAQLLEDHRRLREAGLEDVTTRALAQYGDAPTDEKGRPTGYRPETRPGVPRGSFGDVCDDCVGRGGGGIGGDVGGGDGLGGIDDGYFGDSVFLPDETPEIVPVYRCPRWESVGPTNYGGRVRGIVYHPTDADIVYSGNAQGGVYRSADGGTSWYPTMSGELTLEIGDIAVAPSDGDVVYAGTGEYNGWRYRNGDGIYVSRDGAADWDLTGSAPASIRISTIVVDPSDPDLVYVAGNAGLERTADGGDTWTTLYSGTAVSDIFMDPRDPEHLFIGCENGDGIQETSGARAASPSWSGFNTGLTLMRDHSSDPEQNYLRIDGAYDASGTLVPWCQINSLPDPWTGSEPPGMGDYDTTVYRHDGSQWNSKHTHGTSYIDWTSVIAVEPGDPDVVYSGNRGLDWTSDGGDTWNGLGAGHADNHAVAFSPDDARTTLLGNDGGLWSHTRQVDSAGDPRNDTWDYTDANQGHSTAEFLNVSVSKGGTNRVAGSTQDIGVLISRTGTQFDGIGGAEWGPVEVYAGDGDIVVWDPKGLGLRRSDDGGQNRRDATGGLGGRQVNEIALDPTDADVMLVGTPSQEVAGSTADAAIYRSTNGGASTPTFSEAETVPSRVGDLAFAPSDTSRVYAAVGDDVWVSTDNGASWDRLDAGPVSWAPIASLTVDWSDPDCLFVTYVRAVASHVWRGEADVSGSSIDWTDLSGRQPVTSLPDVAVHRLVLSDSNPERLFVATDVGVFRSEDGGDWWYSYDEGLPNAFVNDIDFRRTSESLYVSTFGRGMYRRSI